MHQPPVCLPSIHFVVQPVQSAYVSIHVGKHHVHKCIINLIPRPLQIGKQPGNEAVSIMNREFMYHVPLQEA